MEQSLLHSTVKTRAHQWLSHNRGPGQWQQEPKLETTALSQRPAWVYFQQSLQRWKGLLTEVQSTMSICHKKTNLYFSLTIGRFNSELAQF